MKIVAVSYREWALKIYDYIAENTNHNIYIIRNKEQYNEDVIKDFKPDIILYYGWSWKISSSILNEFISIMLHPSPLPKYRGGSPIQNQIIRGEKVTFATLLKMTEVMDGGPIIAQKEISLEGHITDIFGRLTEAGIDLTIDILTHGISYKNQEESLATVYKRRKPIESEITLDEIKNQSSEYLYNKIRMLEDPYPNAYIRTSDGKKLLIKEACLE